MSFSLPPGAMDEPTHRLQVGGERKLMWWWATGGLAGVPLLAGLLYIVLDAFDRDSTAAGRIGPIHMLAAVAFAAAVVALVAMFIALPWFFTAQEIVVDSYGVRFKQKPMWWFSGRQVLIPWSTVKSIATGYGVSQGTPMNPSYQEFYNKSPGERRTFVQFTLSSAPTARLPTWVKVVPAREAPGKQPLLTFRVGRAEVPRQIEHLLRRQRPDLFTTP